jgi:hypothetical protein
MISNAAEDLGDSKTAYISIKQAVTKSMKKHKLTLLKLKLIYTKYNSVSSSWKKKLSINECTFYVQNAEFLNATACDAYS